MVIWLASAASIIICLVIVFFTRPIISVFNSEAGLMSVAFNFMRIQLASYLVWGMVVALTQVLNGVGDTLVPMATNFVTGWVIQMALAYYLPGAGGLGVYGVRWAIVAAIFGRAIIFPIYFKMGRWKQRKV
jgi:Na+-driven multidrug efflux pump